MLRIPAILLMLLLLGALLLPGQELNTTQQAQVARLEHQFMSPCCYGEQLYGHLSPQALEMKQQISQMVLEGRNEREIIDHFKSKFGARILVEPEGAQWWVMNVVPLLLLLLGFLATVWVIRKWYRPAAPKAA
ncbi:MAG: cytochrome c-type biogenesis protein CcmH [Bryobacterales bacterium]|nr:cytochrome c-type biogenesis protein CcmH [Bryobacterales bacterium]